MYCSACAEKLDKHEVICPKCGKPSAAFNFTGSNAAQVEPSDGQEPTVIRQRAAGHSRDETWSGIVRDWLFDVIGQFSKWLIFAFVAAAAIGLVVLYLTSRN